MTDEQEIREEKLRILRTDMGFCKGGVGVHIVTSSLVRFVSDPYWEADVITIKIEAPMIPLLQQMALRNPSLPISEIETCESINCMDEPFDQEQLKKLDIFLVWIGRYLRWRP